MAGSWFRPQVNPVELEGVLQAADVDDFRIWWEQGLAQARPKAVLEVGS